MSAGWAPASRALRSTADGHGARCTDPSCHHDQTSSVTNGTNGANRRSTTDERPLTGLGRRGRSLVVAGPAPLDEFDVVVAEAPEELFGLPKRRRVVVGLEVARSPTSTSSRQVLQHAAIDGLGDRPGRLGLRQHELRCVEQLDGQPPPHLHLARVERGVDTRPALGGPVANRVRAVLFEQGHRRHHVALRLRHLLAVGVEHPSGDGRVGPRQRVVLEVRPQHRREEPRPDDVVRLRAQVHRETCAATGPGPVSQPQTMNGVSDEVAQVSITSGSPTKPPGRPRWPASKPVGHVGRRIDRQAALGGHAAARRSRSCRRRRTRYQTGNGTPKNRCRLTHQSPFRPLTQFSNRARMYGGEPLQLAAPLDERLADVHRLDEPLAARDDLERPVALLEELHVVRDRPRLADQIARRAQQVDDPGAGLRRRQARERVVGVLGAPRHRATPSRRLPT